MMEALRGELVNEEDDGYGIYYSDEDTASEPTVDQHGELPLHQQYEPNVHSDSFPQPQSMESFESDSSSSEESSHNGLFGCQRRISSSEPVETDTWVRISDSSNSTSSHDHDDHYGPMQQQYHRTHRSEGEISALIESLMSFSILSHSEYIPTSKPLKKPRPRSNTIPAQTPVPWSKSMSCIPLAIPSNRNKLKKKSHSASQDSSPITLLPSLKSTLSWGSFSSIANFLNAEKFIDENVAMIDGDSPIEQSDLSPRIVHSWSDDTQSYSIQQLKCRSFHVVTTAALPWMTGTAVNPLLRAAYLNKMNREAVETFRNSGTQISPWECKGHVTLVIPWLIDSLDRQELYGSSNRFDSTYDQEIFIRSWLRNSAQMPLEADQDAQGIRIIFYAARYSKELGSIFALGDICNLISDHDADCCILEEPEHLNWMRPMDDGIPLWTEKFTYVVGIIHTNYKAYASAHVSGFISSPFIGSLSSLMTRAHCHKIIKLSSCLQVFAPDKEIVCNTHGVRGEFLTREACQHTVGDSCKTIYFIGKLLWAKGLDNLLQLQYSFKRTTGDFFKIDIYGSGPDETEIKRAFRGTQEDAGKNCESDESLSIENIFRRENILRSIDSFMSDLPSLRNEWKRAPIPAEFRGRIDHSELKGQSKIFINPSITEVLCTTTAEALAMGHFIIIPHHPSNAFFEDFPNCLVYNNSTEFVTQLQFAINHQPLPLSPESSYKLSWEAATLRFISASITTKKDSSKRNRKADEKAIKFLRSALAGAKGDMIRTMIGGKVVGEQYQYSQKGKDRSVSAASIPL